MSLAPIGSSTNECFSIWLDFGEYYGAPCVKLRNIKFCIIFWLNYVQYHILLQFIYIAAICVKLLQFMYIAAICVNCCNLCILQKKL